MRKRHPRRNIHFPGLTGPFFRPFSAILRALLSLSLSPTISIISAVPFSCCTPAPATWFPRLSSRHCSLKSQGHRPKDRGCFHQKLSLLSHAARRKPGERGGGGGRALFPVQNPGLKTLLGFACPTSLRIAVYSRCLSIKARIDSRGNKWKNLPQAFQQNYLCY